jgi:hypothetical protein
LRTRAFAAREVYGIQWPVAKSATWPSRSLAISLTWDFDRPVMPKLSTGFFIRRVLTPIR